MSVGGHLMTRAEKLSLPQLYNQYLYTAYYIRAGLFTYDFFLTFQRSLYKLSFSLFLTIGSFVYMILENL
jgi:hypothetical protein